jgi:hypothetical protein
MNRLRFPIFLLFIAASIPPVASGKEAVVIKRETRQLAGWTVRVDLSLSNTDAGTTAMELLEADLRRIRILMKPDVLAKMQQVPIVLDRECGDLTPMQYHPSADWLRDNGYGEDLARCVHIPKAAHYIDPQHVFTQPSCILHELAHAFHDQVLGFDDKRIIAAFARAQLEGKYEKVLFIRGGTRRHYALTNHKEYFAEATEAWFGTNDFHPFVRSELQLHDPELAKVMAAVWGE